jgi:hypothetical protein
MTEVVRAYPGFYAIASYRIAHYLHGKDLGLIARMITENAHSKTGIDIHPGARIGRVMSLTVGRDAVRARIRLPFSRAGPIDDLPARASRTLAVLPACVVGVMSGVRFGEEVVGHAAIIRLPTRGSAAYIRRWGIHRRASR